MLDYTRLGVFQKYPFTEEQDRIPKKYHLVKTLKASIPTKDDWKRLDFLIDPNLESLVYRRIEHQQSLWCKNLGQTIERAFLWES